MPDQRTGYLVAGLPGAGKSAVGGIISEVTDGQVIETGDIVRQAATRHGITNPDSDELGEFAAEMRDIRGNAFATEILVGEILREEREVEYPVILVGVRHHEEVTLARDFLDRSQLFMVSAERETRLDRLQDRDRDGEGRFDMAQLMQRDGRELNELGLTTIQDSDRIDTSIDNNGTLDELRERVADALWYTDG